MDTQATSGAADEDALAELLAQSGWLVALARRLVEPAGAEDLVQETWLKVLSRRARPAGDARAWLAAVMRNLARDQGRSTEARKRRESEYGLKADDRACPTPNELAGALEARAILIDALRLLTDPERTTLLLRYQEGLSSSAIARREGVSESAIRSRLERALAELRARLDQRAGGDRRRWGLWLGPLAACGEPRVAKAVLASSGGLVLWLGLACGAALVAGILLSRAEEPQELVEPLASTSTPGATVEGSPRSAAGTRGALAGTELDSARVTTATTEGERFTLRARLVDEEGAALRAGRLSLFEARAETDLVEIAWVCAEKDGRVELQVQRSSMPARQLFAAGHAPGCARVFLPLAPARLAAAELELGELHLAPGGDVAGRVVDEDGLPLAGAGLAVSLALGAAGPEGQDARRLWPLVEPLGGPYLPVARSDEFGAFEIVGVPSGSYALVARAAPDSPALLPARVEPLAIAAGERTDVGALVLARAQAEEEIAGFVVDGDERALAGIRVTIEDEGVKVPGGAVSRADGSFSLLVPRARQWNLHARDPERRWMPAEVSRVASGAHDVRLRLVAAQEPPVSVAAADPIGPVVAPPASGAELAGRLTLGGVSPGSWSVHVGTLSTQLDASGGFRLRALSPGKVWLTIRSGLGGDVETLLATELVLEDGRNAWELDLPAAALTLENLPAVEPAEDEPAVADTPEFFLEGTCEGASLGILFQELAEPRRTLPRVPAGRWKLSRRADGFRFGGEGRWVELAEFELVDGETRRLVLP